MIFVSLFFSYFTTSSLYSIDIGADHIRVSFTTNDGQISVQPTYSNKRYNNNLIAYGINDSETDIFSHKWYVGSDAYIVLEQNCSSHVVKNPFSYLEHPSLFPLPGIHPNIASAIVVGTSLPDLVPKNDKVAIVIPSLASPQYRFALRDVLSLTNIKKFSFIEKSTAIAVSYIVERLNRSIRAPTDVMFVDIGTTETEISTWRFSSRNTQINAQLLNLHVTKEVSGNSLDESLLSIILSKIGKKADESDSNFVDHLRQIAKKKKEIFTFSENVTINMTDEFGIESFNITQEEIGNETTQKLLSIVQTFKTPDRVEFVGGASKFPLFNKTLADFFGDDVVVAHSLSPDEASTLGAIYYEAIQARILFGLKLNITRDSIYGFSVNKAGKVRSLVDPETKIGKRMISMLEKGDFYFQVLTNLTDKRKKQVKNFNETFLTIKVKGLSKIAQTKGIKSSSFIINATFDYDKDIDSFELTSLKTSNAIDGAEKVWSLGYEISLTDPSFEIPPKTERIANSAIQTLKGSTKKPTIAQKLLLLIYETLNRVKFDSDFEIVTTSEERANVTRYLNEVRSNLTTIAKNPKEIKATLAHVERRLRNELLRADERRERPGAIAALQIAIDKAEEALPKATTDEAAIKRFTEYLNITTIWKMVAEDVDPLMNPVILTKDIYRRANTLVGRIPELFAPKRHVTHFRTAPPMTPEPEKPAATDQTANETSNNINETSNNVNETSNNINETSNNVNETSNNINETSNNVNETSNDANETAADAKSETKESVNNKEL